jgi:competence protein ComEA
MGKHWHLTLLAVFLVGVIATGGILTWQRYRPVPAIEIYLKTTPVLNGDITITGDVISPGVFPLRAVDTLSDLIKTAGGLNYNGTASVIIDIRRPDMTDVPQKIDINHAQPWLLEALPGIGKVRAQAIVDYRLRNGLFHSISELADVNGMSRDEMEKIRDLITVTG